MAETATKTLKAFAVKWFYRSQYAVTTDIVTCYTEQQARFMVLEAHPGSRVDQPHLICDLDNEG